MTLFTRSLWPETTRWPYLRLALGLVVAPLLLASVLTLLAFLLAGSTEPDRDSTLAVTRHAAGVFFTVLPGFTLTFGLVGVAVLWALGRRGVLAWFGTGAASGAIVLVLKAMLVSWGIGVIQAAVAVGSGIAIFALIRWIAGIRLN
jgi:uncharacterized membrane protein